ncbi:MAG: peroxiredoxin [Chloroflexi bacterium]|nr:peroxiredoxin [Chloroflexota bacterium]
MLEIGAMAPTDSVLTDTGDSVSLQDFHGQRVMVYFYPKSDTPGCTTEACEIRDDFTGFGDLGVVVLGVSPDPVKAQAKFRKKFDLPFTLVADEQGLKKFMGREYMGVTRSTFIIEPDGTIGHVFAKVTPKGHAQEVLAYLRG